MSLRRFIPDFQRPSLSQRRARRLLPACCHQNRSDLSSRQKRPDVLGRFLIGGHRGMGENLWGEGLVDGPITVVPRYRENSVRSLIKAAQIGVDFVEFDVQVTRDGVPVLWHDDRVLQCTVRSGSGSKLADALMSATDVKDMTLQSFRQVVAEAPPCVSQAAVKQQRTGTSSRGLAVEDPRGMQLQLVRQFRVAYSKKQMDGAALPWACAQEEPLPTLAEVCAAVPSHCGFNVEIKMTTGPDVARTPEVEVARVVDAIWTAFETEGKARNGSSLGVREMFFSSFDPDVCTAMSRKQSEYGVWFLSGCGLYPHVDLRRTGVNAALTMVKEHNLAGVVLPAQVLLEDDSTVARAAALGVRLMTYGLDNDSTAAVERQRQLGVHGVIVDDVQSFMQAFSGR